MKTILVEGGSTAYGFYDAEQAGWANRLQVRLAGQEQTRSSNPTIVVNRALPGRSLPAVTRGFGEMVANFQRMGDVAAVVSCGLNEAKIFPGKPDSIVSADHFYAHLGKLVTIAEDHDLPLVLVGPQPVNEAKTTPTTHGARIYNATLEAHSQLMREVCAEGDAVFVDTYKLLGDYPLAEVLDQDGYHPNALGHVVLEQAVSGALGLQGS